MASRLPAIRPKVAKIPIGLHKIHFRRSFMPNNAKQAHDTPHAATLVRD